VPLPPGIKAFNKTKPMKLEDFDSCADWWGEGKNLKAKSKRKNREENQFAWKVSINEIIARNYNLDIKNPHVGETVSHDPEELLADYAKQQAAIQALRDELKTILSEALTR
jgi:type I restriction enzyme M protein